ncbi:hypothetical protein D3C76_1425620 [compost metagenome]
MSCGRIDQQVVEFDQGKVLGDLANAIQEQPIGHVKAIGFVNSRHFAVALHRQLEGATGYAFAAMPRDFAG